MPACRVGGQSFVVRRHLFVVAAVLVSAVAAASTVALMLADRGSTGARRVAPLPAQSAPPPSEQEQPDVSASDGPSQRSPDLADRIEVPPLPAGSVAYDPDVEHAMVAGVVWVDGVPSDPTPYLQTDVQRELFDELNECFPRDIVGDAVAMGVAKDTCYDPLVVALAHDTPAPFDLFSAIRGLNAARPELFTLCHNSSHTVGEITFKRFAAVSSVDTDAMRGLIEAGGPACMGGLVHGVYDAFGLSDPEVSEFPAMIEACLTSHDLLGYCSDAVGHAAWDAYEEFAPAVAACSWWQDETWWFFCAEGIIMRVFQRLEPLDQFYAGTSAPEHMDRWVDEVTDICARWPETWPAGSVSPPPVDDPRTGCWRGSMYLLMKPLGSALQRNANDWDAAAELQLELLPQIDDACGRFGSVGAELCRSHMGPFVGHFSTFDYDAATVMCGVLREVDVCVEGAHERIRAALAGEG